MINPKAHRFLPASGKKNDGPKTAPFNFPILCAIGHALIEAGHRAVYRRTTSYLRVRHRHRRNCHLLDMIVESWA